jgi:transposase
MAKECSGSPLHTRKIAALSQENPFDKSSNRGVIIITLSIHYTHGTFSSLFDPKAQALRRQGTLYPHPEKVTDPLFARHDFFDPRDGLQVKYEMLRRVQAEGQSITQAAATFGLSRPAFYHAQSAFRTKGLAGLIPLKRGPRHAHKLTEESLDFVENLRCQPGSLSIPALLQRLRDHFGLVVHRRSLERALVRRKKKHLERPSRVSDTSGLSEGA